MSLDRRSTAHHSGSRNDRSKDNSPASLCRGPPGSGGGGLCAGGSWAAGRGPQRQPHSQAGETHPGRVGCWAQDYHRGGGGSRDMALDIFVILRHPPLPSSPPPSLTPPPSPLSTEMCWYINYEYSCTHAYHNRFVGLCSGAHCTPCGAIQFIPHPAGYPVPLCPVCINAPAHPWTIIWGHVNGIWSNFSPGRYGFMEGVLELNTVSKQWFVDLE